MTDEDNMTYYDREGKDTKQDVTRRNRLPVSVTIVDYHSEYHHQTIHLYIVSKMTEFHAGEPHALKTGEMDVRFAQFYPRGPQL